MSTPTSLEYRDKEESYFSTPRREMLEFVPSGARRLLEIGCGTGSFGALVKSRHDCHYTGVELVADFADQARTRLDEVLVFNVEADELPFEQHTFDGLICNDVLEHLVDPWSTLKRLVGLIKPGGFVVVSLPNVRFSEVVKDLVFRNQWTYREQGVLDRTHLRFFTSSTARQLLDSAGLNVSVVKLINPIQFAWRLQLLNILLLGRLSPMRYPQIAVVGAVPTPSS